MQIAGAGYRVRSEGPTVLFVSSPVGVGGSTRSMANLLSYMGGAATRVLAGPPSGRFANLVRDLDAAEVYMPIVSSERPRPPRRALTAVKLAWFARRNRRALSAMHANGLKEMSLSIPAAVLSGVPLVVWVHEFGLPPSVLRLGWLWRRLLSRIDVRFATVSPLSRDLVAGAGLTRADDVTIVPNPIDPADVLAPADSATADADDPRLRVAFLGTPAIYKGFQYLPEIIERTCAEAPVRWLIFSRQTDDELADVWDTLRAMTETHPVSIEGKFTDVGTAYGRCDIVVCPSELESFCRVAAEAMLNGIPVVGSDLEPVRALLGDDEAGILFPVGDVDAAAKAVVRLATDPSLRDEQGAVGRRRAQAFAPDVVGAQFRTLYGLA
ncbi:MAG TPA: glycosyltransferase family 4 protein [Acidimicrobiales bacterium]|jgi:phosphatidylinositol alpha-mannosyltransferase|nr:glycosyltransferase family 4 protein [Acidimicrobiales bacterium]